jgi:hypothetical protein
MLDKLSIYKYAHINKYMKVCVCSHKKLYAALRKLCLIIIKRSSAVRRVRPTEKRKK